MSNPTTTVGNSIPEPGDPTVVRKSFTRIVFSDEEFYLYADGENSGTFDPTNKGQKMYLWYSIENTGVARPDFVSTEAWNAVGISDSGFITANQSVMPKLIFPSTVLVDNGVVTSTFQYEAYQDGDLFNWTGNIAGTWDNDWNKYLHLGGSRGSSYITSRWKDDMTVANNSLEIFMDNPTTPPTGEWEDKTLVVGGAFTLLLNITPSVSGTADPKLVNENTWSLEIVFGSVTIVVGEAGSLKVTITDGDNRTYSGNLAEGKTKEGPPQQKHIDGKDPLVLAVYPVWNGVVVKSGGQDSKGVVKTSSTLAKKYEAASIFVDYSSGFDPVNPAAVKVDTTGGPGDVVVDFGTRMTVTAKNCRFDLAYLPAFFTTSMWFDEWFLASVDSAGVVSYSYKVYPIWTDNGTDYVLTNPTVNASSYSGPTSSTKYSYVNWRMDRTDPSKFFRTDPSKFLRYAGELFGEVLEVDETRKFPVKNGNGNFSLTWTGGVPGGGTGGWQDYIQSVTTTVDIDGSNGSITVDKYGVAGQDALAYQSLGAITLSMQGATGTIAGSVFQGLAMGIADSSSAGNSVWTIPLVGLEKKMEDIMLINVPFFDGHTLTEAVDFLCRYAGINYSLANANGAVTLSVSSDVNVPRFDWKSGTSVKQALDLVMEDTLHRYVVRDGMVYFYQLNSIGLPVSPGPDRSGGYTNTKIVSIDRTPVFDNLRNQIVMMSLEAVPEGAGTSIFNIPLFPIYEVRTNTTIPDVPWAKSMFRPLSGALTQAQLSNAADKQASLCSTYDVVGNVTIPGNASIRPYDMWGAYIIKSVTNTMDMQNKTWTTSMELTKATNV